MQAVPQQPTISVAAITWLTTENARDWPWHFDCISEGPAPPVMLTAGQEVFRLTRLPW
jgi:hypothetical protein